jgi:hypothetical protein
MSDHQNNNHRQKQKIHSVAYLVEVEVQQNEGRDEEDGGEVHSDAGAHDQVVHRVPLRLHEEQLQDRGNTSKKKNISSGYMNKESAQYIPSVTKKRYHWNQQTCAHHARAKRRN